jgi:tripartite-type tricarboxylate transporter receptor subunit TctC
MSILTTGLRSLLWPVFAVFCIGSSATLAQGYPDRPIRIIVPFSAGGPNDIIARAVGAKLSENLGQQVIVDNRPGGGTVIGTDIAAHSPADGYTLLMASTSTSVNPTLKKSLPYDTLKDLAFVSLMAEAPNVMVVHPSMPVTTVKQLIALAKSKPGEIAFASGGVGASTHLAAEMFSSMAKVKMIHVPYKGASGATRELIGGQVSWMFGTLLPTMPHVRSGKVRAIGMGGKKPSPVLPAIPPITQALPGFESVGWWAMMVPAGTPGNIVTRLNAEIDKALKSKDLSERLLRDGTEPIGGSIAHFEKFFHAEMKKWADVIRQVGIKPN